MDELVPPRQREAAQLVRTWLARYAEKRDLVTLGAIERGRDPVLDRALDKLPELERFLRQDFAEPAALAATHEWLSKVVR